MSATIYNKAVAVLLVHLSKKELLQLFEAIDGDPHNGFLEELAEEVGFLYPEMFICDEPKPLAKSEE